MSDTNLVRYSKDLQAKQAKFRALYRAPHLLESNVN